MKSTNLFKRAAGILLACLLIFTNMAYSTNSELVESVDETQVLQLIDDENTGITDMDILEATALDNQDPNQAEAQAMLARLIRARADADETIDSFLRTQYDLPLDSTPGMITSLSIDLTYFNLYERRERGSLPEGILKMEERALKKLKMIQAGTIKIQDEPDVAAGQVKTNKTKDDRVFTDDYLSRF